MKTHGYCERHSPRPGKQTITPRGALRGRSTSLFTYIKCVFQKYKHKVIVFVNRRSNISKHFDIQEFSRTDEATQPTALI